MSRQPDDFVARSVPDPNETPELLLLGGYLGASSEDGHVRLYADEELSRYVEVPKGSIRHARRLTPEQSPLGGSLLWVERDAELMHGKAGAKPGAATFLEGWIADEYREVAAGAEPGGARREARAAAPPGATFPSALCLTPHVSRQVPCPPKPDPFFMRQHYLDFTNRRAEETDYGLPPNVFIPVYTRACGSVGYPYPFRVQSIWPCQTSPQYITSAAICY